MRNRGLRAGLLLAASFIAWASAAQAGETIAYSYDSLGRLIRVEHSGTVNDGVTAGYGYDPADNRTKVTVGGVPTVVGGGFEAPATGTGYVYRPTASPAAFAGNSGVAGNGSIWGFDAPEGAQVAFLQGGEAPAAISLRVTGLTPGTAYKVSYRISARPNFWGVAVSLSFDGAPIGTFNPQTYSFVAATSDAFTATATSGTLVFTAAGTPHNNSGLDHVTIAAAGSHR